MIYGSYKNLRDSAWQCLIDYKVNSLPVDILIIARKANITVLKNSTVMKLQPSESGMSYFNGKRWYIVYDDESTVERKRFTIAHELGHIFLGHELKQGYLARTKTFDSKPEIEREADMFASRILCPSCVLWGLNLHTPEEISKVCRVSLSAARVRADRLKVLCERNMFLTSPLERTLYKNFENFIKNYRE